MVPIWPIEANEVFVPLTPEADKRLKAAGAKYYSWVTDDPADDLGLGAGKLLVRLVTSFQTTKDDVAKFLAAFRGK